MVEVEILLEKLRAAGLTVRVDSGMLIVHGPTSTEALALEVLGRKPEVVARLSEDADVWWNRISAADHAYLFGPRHWPEPCVWCGGRLHHNPMCDALRASWDETVPFGKHKGRKLREVPTGYLRWLLEHSTCLTEELQSAIKKTLRMA